MLSFPDGTIHPTPGQGTLDLPPLRRWALDRGVSGPRSIACEENDSRGEPATSGHFVHSAWGRPPADNGFAVSGTVGGHDVRRRETRQRPGPLRRDIRKRRQACLSLPGHHPGPSPAPESSASSSARGTRSARAIVRRLRMETLRSPRSTEPTRVRCRWHFLPSAAYAHLSGLCMHPAAQHTQARELKQPAAERGPRL
jgi:hypothetical protein